MSRSDWISLGTTTALHLLLLLLFALLSANRPDAPQIGYMEVEFGPFAAGQPVEAVEETTPTESAPETPEPEEQPETDPVDEAEPDPVDLPDADPTDEAVPPTDEEEADPVPETDPEEGRETADPDPEADDEGAEAQEATTTDGADDADPGDSTTEERTAPYDIEGLNRDPQFAPLPPYNEQVNATVRVQITVDPRGNIIRRIPLQRGSPELDAAVMETLSRWRFNALPPGAPQENQTGVITFTFRLE
ncbi:MAG: TonB family protein [Longimonas sp.]|uniref:energy transducer TonB family protein n=1 Tax=Longimonas sp. TaxID=2039626 RepID=UPI003347DD38